MQLGDHPDDGDPILTNTGRFGPYVVHRNLYAALAKGSTPQDVTLEEALQLLTAKAARMRARGKDPYAVRCVKTCKTINRGVVRCNMQTH
jgi:DNA topoisomerase-1